ncbi:MAG: hypothetical protein H0W99_09345 [Acidobacteria bacterium]|nr:hypothetical protein [Acidobacteriota bacterium]
MQQNTRPSFNEQAFWTGNTATMPVTYDFHFDGGSSLQGNGIEALYEPHAPIIYAAGEAELSDEELDELEARALDRSITDPCAPLTDDELQYIGEMDIPKPARRKKAS